MTAHATRSIRSNRLAIAIAATAALTALGFTSWHLLTLPKPPPPLGITLAPHAPITYFEAHCHTCHGDYGSQYPLADLRNRDDASLRDKIHFMSNGPGKSPLTEEQTTVQMAYARAIGYQRPFVCLTKIDPPTSPAAGPTLSGDCTINAKVIIKTPTQEFPADTDDCTWSITLPPNTDLKTAQLLIRKKDKEAYAWPAE